MKPSTTTEECIETKRINLDEIERVSVEALEFYDVLKIYIVGEKATDYTFEIVVNADPEQFVKVIWSWTARPRSIMVLRFETVDYFTFLFKIKDKVWEMTKPILAKRLGDYYEP